MYQRSKYLGVPPGVAVGDRQDDEGGDYVAVINSFSNAWYRLSDKFSISNTPKIHVIIDHLEDYFKETNLSLMKTSDHLIEHIHHYTQARTFNQNKVWLSFGVQVFLFGVWIYIPLCIWTFTFQGLVFQVKSYINI